jgi:mono/diheme cytochrome c family protein
MHSMSWRWKVSKARIFLALTAIITLASCRQDMQDQPKYLPYRGSEIFADSLSSRPLVEGTIPRGFLRLDNALYRGTMPASTPGTNTTAGQSGTATSQKDSAAAAGGGSAVATTFPFVITKEIIDRGEERFNIYCSPCHGMLGDGNGMIAKRGFRNPPSFHIDRLRQAPPGHFVDVMTNGFGVMPDYSMQVPVHERWAIAAYIRALQLTQNATVADVPQQDQAKLK